MSHLLRILIADEQPLIRHALRTLLDQEADLEVVGEASDPQAIRHQVRLLQPDLVLLDIALGNTLHLDLIDDIRRRHPHICLVILTLIEDEAVIMPALQAGAGGYLLKSIAPQDLVQALRAAVAGGTPLHPRIASRILRHLNRPPAKPDPYARLTTREQEILHLLAQGYSNSEIARRLVITEYTVRTHVCRILKKLNLHNRTQAALYVVRRQQASASEVQAASKA